MILYHGSNVDVTKIDLSLTKRGKDFGKGFYLSAEHQQAHNFAQYKVAQFGGDIHISRFEFDEKFMHTDWLRVKVFHEYNEEWANFVFNNRSNMSDIPIHNFDIVYGPIADDKVGVQIRNLIEKNIDMPTFLERLKYMKGITFQYFFGTERAIKLLKRV